jgi:hypothetical protein
VIDALIAATGDAHGLEVVTRNTADLERCGARRINPWSQAAPRVRQRTDAPAEPEDAVAAGSAKAFRQPSSTK